MFVPCSSGLNKLLRKPHRLRGKQKYQKVPAEGIQKCIMVLLNRKVNLGYSIQGWGVEPFYRQAMDGMSRGLVDLPKIINGAILRLQPLIEGWNRMGMDGGFDVCHQCHVEENPRAEKRSRKITASKDGPSVGGINNVLKSWLLWRDCLDPGPFDAF